MTEPPGFPPRAQRKVDPERRNNKKGIPDPAMAIQLLLGVHAHQPVGNFDAVIDEAHGLCYRPFLQTLARYPDFRFTVHFSGWLLEELSRRHPEDMALLRDMVARGQVEMFGSGDCEPVLAAIPSRDRIGQLDALSARLRQAFGARPRGAWLTERVWEATVVPSLVSCGIEYVAVDDYHFLCTGRREAELDGYYTTEEGGERLDLFPISEALRYRLPFALASEAVAYLESQADAGRAAAVYFDDIEKFGIWPETHEWVYGKRWLEQFIQGVLASRKIVTGTYGEFRHRAPSKGVVYLPTTSYSEMNEWTLPAEAAAEYAGLLAREKAAGRFERTRPYLRGGIWRNFLSRYPESNWMHKRMLGLSARLARLAPERAAPLTGLLYRAQANDAYWHGLFGGLYLPHLRRAVWQNLVELERELDALLPRPPLERADVDADGKEELLLHDDALQLALRLDGHGAVHELDAYGFRHNFADTLARRPEHYHVRTEEAGQGAQPASGIASPHDRNDRRHAIAPEDLAVDREPRACFVDVWQPDDGEPVVLAGYALQRADAGGLEFNAAVAGGEVRKRYTLGNGRLTVDYAWTGLPPGRLRTRLNLAMPSADGYAGRYILQDGSIPCGFGQELVQGNAGALALDDQWLGAAVALAFATPMAVTARPCHTVSLSEAGLEKIMQCAEVTLTWPAAPGAGRQTVSLAVTASRP